MQRFRKFWLTAGALIATLAFWGLIRLIFPALDYYPPEQLVARFERSWFVTAGIRKATMVAYAACAVLFMTVFFSVVQQRWPGRGVMKGFIFATFLSVIWAIAFLMGWGFLGMSLQAALLNGVIDWIGLAAAGLAIGAVMGTNTKGNATAISWPAVFLVSLVFLLVYAIGAAVSASAFPASIDLLRLPSRPIHFLLLFGLGVWSGLMFAVLRTGLPFANRWARAAFFAFGVFGHSWAWFHLFFVIEFASVLPLVLTTGLIGAVSAFAGVMGYELTLASRRWLD
ncbi:MAG: hypothetical protein GY947_11345 [Rhodobacteraceae bacterium]|nr:hypothetical protein [Paracoccaceae bacterium]